MPFLYQDNKMYKISDVVCQYIECLERDEDRAFKVSFDGLSLWFEFEGKASRIGVHALGYIIRKLNADR